MNTKTRTYDSSKRKAQSEERKRHIAVVAAEMLMNSEFENFTLEVIAERAGVSVQTILRAYGSKDDLFIAALSLYGPSDKDFSKFGRIVDGDIRYMVATLYDTYETIGDAVVRMLAKELDNPALKADGDVGRNYHRGAIAHTYADYLDPLPPAKRRILYHAILVNTDIYVWQSLRRDEALSVEDAVTVVTRTIEALLREFSDD